MTFTKILLLTKLDKPKMKLREDLMSPNFPSIWVEEEIELGKNIIIGGFYREWSIDGTVSSTNQTTAIKIFTSQMEAASRENKSIIVLGDANICAIKWDDPITKLTETAEELKSSLALCGLTNIAIGNTYLADRLDTQGNTILTF